MNSDQTILVCRESYEQMRADVEHMRRKLLELQSGWVATMDAKDQLMAEVERMRPLVEAAKAWKHVEHASDTRLVDDALWRAVRAYEAAVKP